MKKTTLAFIFVFLLVFSCIFTSCNAHRSLLDSEESTIQSESDPSPDLTIQIEELKNQIIDLEQNHYISNIERNNEIKRLETLIEELKKKPYENDDTETTNDSESTAPDIPTNTVPPESSESDKESEKSQFYYEIIDGQATITGYEGSDSVLIIPSEIDGYEVTTIYDDAFTSQNIENITIPNTVTKIGWFAFRACSNLKSVTIPDSVSSIGYSAFPQNSSSFSIICSSTSFAAKYAKSYGINFTTA